MKVPFRHLIYLTVIIFPSCTTKESLNKVKITIQSTTQLDADVKLSRYTILESTTLFESKTDTNGYCSFEMTLKKPMFALIQIGEKYGELYLAPDYDFVVYENGQDYQIPLIFSGRGSAINNYVSWVNSTVEKIKWADDKGLIQLSSDDFFARYESLKNMISNFHRSYLDSVRLSNETVAKLEQKNRIKLAGVAQEYAFYQLNNAINEKADAQKSGKPYEEFELSKELEAVVTDIPFDTTLLTDGHSDYQILLNLHWQNKVHLPTAELVTTNSSASVTLVSDSLIKKTDYPEGIREVLTAFNLKYWLAAFGITPETEAVFADFKRRYQHSRYLPILNKSFGEWLAVAPGSPAPYFEGYALNGDTISLHDLRGKIVYMDVWATWCGPCVAEVPAAKVLQQKFLNEKGIQFLNVSVDSDKSKWDKFLQNDKNWKGLHIIIDPGKIQSFYTDYKLLGVPGYILIDSSGKIVNMKAPRPSAPEIIDEIKKLLAAEK